MIQLTPKPEARPTLVILNGLSRTTQHWFGFDSLLEPYFRVVAIDLPGAGDATEECHWSMRIEDMAAHVMEKLDALAIQKAHVLGVSLGGMVAMGCGLAFPERCQSLTLVNSSIGSGLSLGRLSHRASLWLLKAIITRPGPERLNRQMAALTMGCDCSPFLIESVIQKSIALQQKPNPARVLMQLLAALRFRPGRRLAELKMPTLVVHGGADRFVPPHNSQRIAQHIPHAQLVSVENGGHDLMYDKAESLLQLLKEWTKPRKDATYG